MLGRATLSCGSSPIAVTAAFGVSYIVVQNALRSSGSAKVFDTALLPHYNDGMSKKRHAARSETAMQVRVPPETLEAFKKAAERDNRTLSGWVRDRLEKAAKAELER